MKRTFLEGFVWGLALTMFLWCLIFLAAHADDDAITTALKECREQVNAYD